MNLSLFFFFASVLASVCVADCHHHANPYKGLNVTYKKVRVDAETDLILDANPPQSHICETTPGVNSFSGYVHLPANLLAETQDASDPYNISTFFWYFEVSINTSHAGLRILTLNRLAITQGTLHSRSGWRVGQVKHLRSVP
jgi:hypothetical protein